MSKIYETKEIAIDAKEELEIRLDNISNNILHGLIEIKDNLSQIETADVTKDIIALEVVNKFEDCVKLTETKHEIETQINEINDDIYYGIYNSNDLTTRHCIEVHEFEDGSGFYSYFRDEYRHWYYAILAKEDNKIEAKLFTLANNTYKCPVTISKVLTDDDYYESEYNKDGLIRFINDFLSVTWDVCPENVY